MQALTQARSTIEQRAKSSARQRNSAPATLYPQNLWISSRRSGKQGSLSQVHAARRYHSAVRYQQTAPPPRLAPWVHCVWIFECSEPSEGPDRIVPDGRPELVIHYGRPFGEVGESGAAIAQHDAIFAGQVTRPLVLRSAGNAGVLGVRFRPGGARAFLGMPMRHATDQRIALEALFPGEGSALAREVAAAADDARRASIAGDFVLARITAHGHAEDAIVTRSVATLEARAGAIPMDDLVAAAGIGRRQLERRFGDAVGIGPALLASILRFRSVFDVIEHDGSRPWTDAALAAGYYDQSHFIREFRRFVGCTPSAFARHRDGLAAALVETA
jgi:AraC-like DNA-binding protein